MPEPLRTIRSRTLVLPFDHIDTDQIIPARFLTTTVKDGLGRHAFADWREREGSPFADPRAPEARILVAGDDFGCGSSREHAAWALRDFGFRAVVSTSIADIFRTNAQKNGLVPVVVDRESHAFLIAHPWCEAEVDVEAQELRIDGRGPARFRLDPFARRCLLDGVDELGFLLAQSDAISVFEEARS